MFFKEEAAEKTKVHFWSDCWASPSCELFNPHHRDGEIRDGELPEKAVDHFNDLIDSCDCEASATFFVEFGSEFFVASSFEVNQAEIAREGGDYRKACEGFEKLGNRLSEEIPNRHFALLIDSITEGRGRNKTSVSELLMLMPWDSSAEDIEEEQELFFSASEELMGSFRR